MQAGYRTWMRAGLSSMADAIGMAGKVAGERVDVNSIRAAEASRKASEALRVHFRNMAGSLETEWLGR